MTIPGAHRISWRMRCAWQAVEFFVTWSSAFKSFFCHMLSLFLSNQTSPRDAPGRGEELVFMESKDAILKGPYGWNDPGM